jgi:hypothetical protein
MPQSCGDSSRFGIEGNPMAIESDDVLTMTAMRAD